MPPTVPDRLIDLNLEDNLLETLPSEFGHLTSLTRLTLSFNKLTDMPVEIGHLRDLRFLVADHNHLVEMPACIGMLTSLVNLDLSNNRLFVLLPTLGMCIPALSLLPCVCEYTLGMCIPAHSLLPCVCAYALGMCIPVLPLRHVKLVDLTTRDEQLHRSPNPARQPLCCGLESSSAHSCHVHSLTQPSFAKQSATATDTAPGKLQAINAPFGRVLNQTSPCAGNLRLLHALYPMK